MKKTTLFCACILAILFSACEDKSGDYIEQLCTNAEMTSGIRACLSVSKDTAVAHLCMENLMCDNEDNRIGLPNNATFNAIRNALATGSHTDLLDTLEQQLNRACEQLGDDATSAFKTDIDKFSVAEPATLVKGGSDAITSYYRMSSATALQSALADAFAAKMRASGATDTWNAILDEYHTATGNYATFDLNGYTLQQFLDRIFTEMAAEEKLIRSDASHRVNDQLKKVFGGVDN